MDATREVAAIYHPTGFAYEISHGCIGLVPAALLGVSISVYPAGTRTKLIGLAVGIPLLIGVNFARLVHLFYLGVHRPDFFHVAHTVVWQGVIIVTVVGLWLTWTLYAERYKCAPGS
jgi:exosortase/archaeosortase family protein